MDETKRDKYVHNPNVPTVTSTDPINESTQPEEVDASTGKSQVYDYSELDEVVVPMAHVQKPSAVNIPDSPPSRKRRQDPTCSSTTSSNAAPSKKIKEMATPSGE
jgi:hypothetical protein